MNQSGVLSQVFHKVRMVDYAPTRSNYPAGQIYLVHSLFLQLQQSKLIFIINDLLQGRAFFLLYVIVHVYECKASSPGQRPAYAGLAYPGHAD